MIAKKGKVPKFPPYVFEREKTGSWFVRRAFATTLRHKNGNLIYTQVVRRCDPHTPERAREVADAIEQEYLGALPPAIAEQTVGGFLIAFLAAKRGSVEVRTHEGYEYLVDRYLTDTAFEKMPLVEVSPLVIQSFYSELIARGVSGQMVRKLHTVLSMAFNQAVLWNTLAKNPCKGVILPPPPPRECLYRSHVERRSSQIYKGLSERTRLSRSRVRSRYGDAARRVSCIAVEGY